MSSIKDNIMSFSSKIQVIHIAEVDIITIADVSVSSNNNYWVDSGMKINTSYNLGDIIVYLDVLLTIIIGLAFSLLNIIALIFYSPNYHFLTSISFVVLIDHIIKSLVLLTWAQFISCVMFVFMVIRPFEDIYKIIAYKEYLIVVFLDKE